MLRWLLPVFTVLTLVGSAVTSWAAAGVFGESSCCCPEPAKCKCHDHDGKPKPTTLKRCGGEAKLVAPAIAIAIPTSAPDVVDRPRLIAVAPIEPIAIPSDLTYEPETPPF